jgi:hypothetical protein
MTRKTDYGKGTCPECGREGISLTANGRLRSHITGPGEPNCGGGSGPTAESLRPSEADLAAAEQVIGSDAPGDVENAAHDVIERAVRYGTVPSAHTPSTHVHHFEYDDDGWHSGSFCECGQEEPVGPHRAAVSGPRETETEEHGSWGKTHSVHRTDRSPVPSSGPGTTASAPDAEGRSSKVTTSAPTAKETTHMPTASKAEPAPKDVFSSPAKGKTANDSLDDRYDSYGRYKIKVPGDKRRTPHTRVTTFSSSIADTYALSMWSQRMTLKGATIRPDLVAMAHTLDVSVDKDRMNDLVAQAKSAAGDKVSANLGTAVHSFTESVDKGDPLSKVPEDYQSVVLAYQEILDQAFEVVPYMIERSTLAPEFDKIGVAGTFDRVYRVKVQLEVVLDGGETVTLYPGEYVIGDVKTGRDLKYAWNEIAIQLAMYARGVNTNGVYNWADHTWEQPHTLENVHERLTVREDVAIVVHMPVQREDDAPMVVLKPIDLREGFAAARLCTAVRGWRKTRVVQTSMRIVPGTESPAQVPARGKERPDAGARAVLDSATGLDESRAVLGATRTPTYDQVKDYPAVADPAPAAELPPRTQEVLDRARTVNAKASEPRATTWGEKFAAVSSRGEASALWAQAKGKVPDRELVRLVGVAKAALSQLEEKAG